MYNVKNNISGKITRAITLSIPINEKLKMENNASGLIEELLTRHFDLQVLKDNSPTMESLDSDEQELKEKAKELNLQLEKLHETRKKVLSQDELKIELSKLDVTNNFLIERLKKMKEPPSALSIKHLKEEYHINLGEKIWKAWRLLHPETEVNNDNQKL